MAVEETVVGLAHEVVHVVWAEVDPQEATCSRELGTGSVLTRAVATRTLPGGWSATSAKPPNQKDWAVALLSPLAVTEVAEVEWECVEAEVWTGVDLQELEALVALEVSVEAGEATVVDSGDVVEWTGEVSEELGVEDHPWTEWVAEAEEEWAHQVARWI